MVKSRFLLFLQYHFLLSFILSGYSVLGQFTFQKAIGGNTGGFHDVCHSAALTNDKGYILAGTTNVFGPTASAHSNILISKLDSCGNGAWATVIAKSDSSEHIYDVQPTFDGGYILAGYVSDDISTNNDNALAIKLDALGNIQWSKLYEVSQQNIFRSVQQTSDSGYIFLGSATTSPSELFDDFYVVKTDKQGVMQWTYKMGVTSKMEFGQRALELSSGGYLLCGYTTATTTGHYDALLLRISATGALLWNKRIGQNSKHDVIYSAQETTDGKFLFIGQAQNGGTGFDQDDILLFKTDSTGNPTWYKLYTATQNTDYGYYVSEVSTNEYILTGRVMQSNFNNALAIIKMDTAGNTQWSRAYGGALTGTSGSYVTETPDNGFFVAGTSPNFGSGTNDMIAIKTNMSGNANACHLISHTLATTSPVPQTTTLSINQIIPSTTVSTTPFIVVDPGNISTGQCAFSFTATAGGDTTICSGSSVQLNAYGGIYYSWAPSAGLNSTFIADPVASPTATTTYSVTIKSYKCFSDSVVGIVTISVNSTPNITVSNDTLVCSSNSVQLSASGGSSGYTWVPAAGLSNTGIANPVASPSVTITYTVVSGTGTCLDSAIVTITVVPQPTLSVSSNTFVCDGNIIQLSVTGGVVYSWSPSSGLNNSGIFNPVASPTITTTYSVYSGANGCADTAMVTVSVVANPTLTVSNDTMVCSANSVQLSAGGGSVYSWNPATGLNNAGIFNPIATPTTTTTYSVYTSTNGCSDIAMVTITVNPLPIVNAGNDTTIHAGSSITLSVTGTGAFVWSPAVGLSCINCSSPVATPTVTTTYYVLFTNSVGCQTTDSITIYIDSPCSDLFIPNAFSPNNDGENDMLFIKGACIKKILFTIYNRWGEKIFESNDITVGWDGTYKNKPLNFGTYAYVVNAILIDDKPLIQKGYITLIK